MEFDANGTVLTSSASVSSAGLSYDATTNLPQGSDTITAKFIGHYADSQGTTTQTVGPPEVDATPLTNITGTLCNCPSSIASNNAGYTSVSAPATGGPSSGPPTMRC